MRTTDQKEQIIQSRTENDIGSGIKVKSFKVQVGEKRMTVIATKNETKEEIEKMLIGKFAEKITML